MKNILKLCLICICIISISCSKKLKNNLPQSEGFKVIKRLNEVLSEACVQDHFTPPVASRNFAYSNIAAYQTISVLYQNYPSLNGLLNNFPADSISGSQNTIDEDLAVVSAFTKVAHKVVYTEVIIDTFRSGYFKSKQDVLDKEVFDASINLGDKVADLILEWASKDSFAQTRNMPEFTFSPADGNWKPTSPDYMPAIEPYWNKIRPFALSRADEFIIERPTTYSEDKQSVFYAEMLDVIKSKGDSSSENTAIAKFWDCNPNISHHHGHVMYFTQKISPGAHWIHIGLQAIESHKLDLAASAAVMCKLSVGIADAFIACWDEKYRSNYIRPETVIKKLVDKYWEPILQTPAFPEYPSGHSVASAAAATVLTDCFGNSFQFIDSSENRFGLPTRSFTSFRAASDEAAISRLYGGIHFRPAIENGILLGNKVGVKALEKLKVIRIKKDEL